MPKRRSQDRLLRNGSLQTAEPALFAITGSKDKTSVLDKFHDHPIKCVSGRSLSSLQERPQCQTVSYVAVRFTCMPPFYFASKVSVPFISFPP